MKTFSIAVAAWVMLPSVPGISAVRDVPIRTIAPSVSFPTYPFRVEVISDTVGVKPESTRDGRPYIIGRPDERYAIRLYNPLPVRVAVNLTVDGVNTISGKPSGIADGEKWLMGPYETLVLRGWQVNGGETRRFFFTPTRKSYAAWRGKHLHKDLAANCGVIGAAFFWNQAELDQYQRLMDARRRDVSMGGSHDAMAALPSRAARAALEAKPAMKEAGTGMGERESHPVTSVDFQYDAGMYNVADAIVIYYGFEEAPLPNPFPSAGYAPEMP